MMRANQPDRIVLAEPKIAHAVPTESRAAGRAEYRQDRIDSKSLISYPYSL